jgi:hypothetical protein
MQSPVVTEISRLTAHPGRDARAPIASAAGAGHRSQRLHPLGAAGAGGPVRMVRGAARR